MSDPAPTPGSASVRCTVHVLVAFDVGQGIDLDHAESRLSAGAHRQGLSPSRRTPPYLDYRPLPVRVSGSVEPMDVMVRTGRDERVWKTQRAFDAVIFDFGAISISLRIEFEGSLTDLLALSDALYEYGPIISGARHLLGTLAETIADAVTRPHVADPVECYVVFQFDDPAMADIALARRPETDALLAGILRSERQQLSDGEVADAVSSRISYGRRDVAMIDWNAAIVVDPGSPAGVGGGDEVRFVLEYANVELLEMRVLDDRLDHILDESYRIVMEQGGGGVGVWGRRFSGGWGGLNRIARLQMDSALLYEGVNNAIKLVGDQYLARVYRLAAARFHLPERDSSIERKLSTLESIYSKLQDRRASLRMEALEWIIILLFVVSIVLPFLSWGHK
jgi:hypothetical protein